MQLDLSKPLISRTDGKPVRLIAKDLKGEFPFAVAVEYSSGAEGIDIYNGWQLESNFKNVPEKRTLDIWVNVYPNNRNSPTYAHLSKAGADQAADGNRTACLRIVREYEVGEGL